MRAKTSPTAVRLRVLTGLPALVAAMIAFGATPTLAQSLQIVQMRQANIYGVVQSGRQVRPVNVTQTGQANVTGIVQAGSNARATVTQQGQTNAAFVGQYQNIGPRGGRLQLP